MSALESLIHVPQPPLSTYVACMWYRRGSIPDRRRELSMPTGSVDLVINLGADRIRVFDASHDRTGIVCRGAIVHGAQSRSFVLDDLQHVHFVGVHFRPGGGSLLGVPADEIADRHLSLDDLWPDGATQLRERLLECSTANECFAVLERALLQRLSSRFLVHPVVSFALRSSIREREVHRVASLQRASGYSERRFTALFSQAVGLTPKKFLRVKRLGSVLARLASGKASLAQVAAESGYFDESHLTRDFRDLTGVAPSAYQPMQRSELHMEIPD
jgi:AraC-like DNA-binding protein